MRAAVQADLAYLFDLYATTRAQELAWAGWPKAVGAAFLENQFDLQHRHFVETDGVTDCWIIERRGEAIGRLYLDRRGPVWRILDIALLPEWQGRGIGGALLEWTTMSARAAKADGVDLHVLASNPRAAALYKRLGFIATEAGTPTHRHMVWRFS